MKSEGSQLRAYAATAIFASCVNWLCNGVFMDQSSILCVLFLSVGSMVQTCVTSTWRTDRDQLEYPVSVWPSVANYMMIDSNQHPIWSEKIVWWRERRKGSCCFFFFFSRWFVFGMKFDVILFDKLLFSILITFYVLCVPQFVHVVDIVHTFGSVGLPGSQKQHPLLRKTQ